MTPRAVFTPTAKRGHGRASEGRWALDDVRGLGKIARRMQGGSAADLGRAPRLSRWAGQQPPGGHRARPVISDRTQGDQRGRAVHEKVDLRAVHDAEADNGCRVVRISPTPVSAAASWRKDPPAGAPSRAPSIVASLAMEVVSSARGPGGTTGEIEER